MFLRNLIFELLLLLLTFSKPAWKMNLKKVGAFYVNNKKYIVWLFLIKQEDP